MATSEKLPEALEQDLTLAHSETCGCTVEDGCGQCADVRRILRRSILAYGKRERADEQHKFFGLSKVQRENRIIWLLAAALKGEDDAS